MKKGLLFALALGLGTFAIGQNLTQHTTKAEARQLNNFAIEQVGTTTSAPIQTNKSEKGALTGITLGYSNNAYGLIVEQQSCLTYNEDLGLLQFTHRAKVGEVFTGGTAVSSGDIITSYSTDGGATWGGLFSYANNDAEKKNNRYPGGIIYNPAGNKDPMKAFTAYVGPVNDNGAWALAFMGSRKFDNTMESNSYLPSNLALIRYGFESNNSKNINVIGTAGTSAAPYMQDTTYLLTGAFNAANNNFDWSIKKFNIDFVTEPDGSDASASSYSNTAWSLDGNTGYFWTMGRHPSKDVRSYQPIVYKTIDAGANWAMMPIFDFSTLPLMSEYLRPLKDVTPEAVRPLFYGDADGVVDANDQLHIIAKVRSTYSDKDDELSSYSYWVKGEGRYPIFDFYTTAAGWDVVHLGSVLTDDVAKEFGDYGDMGWGTRLQAGKTKDGTKIFASWTDTDSIAQAYDDKEKLINLYPDLYVVGFDILTKNVTKAINFSKGTTFESAFFFHYMSDLIISDNGTYTIPMTKMIKGTTGSDPVTHVYVQGIKLTDLDFDPSASFSETINNTISISQNRPNPFTGNTTIDVNLV